MNYFIAKIIFQVVTKNSDHLAQFDEQIRLIHAEDILSATEKAIEIGYYEQTCFNNVNNVEVQWIFIDVPEVYALENISDGIILYSNTLEPDDELQYVKSVEAKANMIKHGVIKSFVKD